jgi:hypothetical protein
MPDSGNYESSGFMYRPEIDTTDFDDDRLRHVVKCTRCGSLVHSGGLSREKHDQFHDALAELWTILSGGDTNE